MYAVPKDSDARMVLNQVPQDVLGRAFAVSGLSYTDDLDRLAPRDAAALAEAAKQFLVMGPHWNRPDVV
jgi:hypothetical protein